MKLESTKDLKTDQFSLEPAFLCPFGWPTQPTYAIDLEPSHQSSSLLPNSLACPSTSSSISTQFSSLLHEWNDLFGAQSDLTEQDFVHFELNQLYLECIYLPVLLPNNSRSPCEKFAAKLRSYSKEYDHNELIEIFESFLIPEDLLARKWSEEIKKLVECLMNETEEDLEIENDEEMFHQNEIAAISIILNHHRLDSNPNHSQVNSRPSSDNEPSLALKIADTYSARKVSFIKVDHNAESLESWCKKENQLQIILLLEIIILTNLSLDTESQLFHKRQLSSPHKNSKKITSEDEFIGPSEAISDWESLLEGLIDRLAMWQVIGELGKELSNLFPDRRVPLGNESHENLDEYNLDDIQRFWTDVVEEHYTSHLPLLNPSFRPKLFPTSIYDPSASSSLLPTQFDSTARTGRNDLSSVNRTPNLKKLEKRALKRAEKMESKAKVNLSPTMMKLKGIERLPISRAGSVSESQLGLKSRAISSRALFNRREVKMSNVPLSIKSSIQRASSTSAVGFNQISKGPWGQTADRKSGEPQISYKRKQSSPKKIIGQEDDCRTEVLATPRKARKINGFLHNDASGVLVPDTPQARHR
ncbi:hypothetical protein O181_075611 [Austropuccinia psidii MF-1]|uniref:DNA replication regulator Sld3 C-terminal domain-containing protein n=1 Tax=Austropuccinia psidii MF-1 TaxID=1389203 RepID=A0A9Q3FEW4_9BASI|nr:hypothetical protein [Austropuccinia psidii MF-1]